MEFSARHREEIIKEGEELIGTLSTFYRSIELR